ncbi:MAG: hypothetical protein ACR2K6_08635, partial [Solirubrobacterales bacterium]
VASIEAGVDLEQGDAALHVLDFEGMKLTQAPDSSRHIPRVLAVARPAGALMRKLLQQIGRRLPAQAPRTGKPNYLLTGNLVGMLASERVDEDRSVVQEAGQ